jgi:hypothetical protein
MNEEQFAKQMDEQNPSWYVDMANEDELRDFARRVMRSRKLGNDTMREVVARRLFVCARATWCGLYDEGALKVEGIRQRMID